MINEMQRRALAARDVHMAQAARTTHCVELEAVHLAISSGAADDITSKFRSVLERLASADFETALAKARQSLQLAMS